MAVKPSSMKEQVDALWQEIIGLNGDGLRDDVKTLKNDVVFIKENMMSKVECAKIRNHQQNKVKRYLDIGIRLIVMAAGVIVALAAAGVLP